jgi:tRNA A-37 threonylcarbamoyl transferase component Bud32
MEEAQAARPILTVAAESIALDSADAESVAGVIGSRALAHYALGIRQYLAVRLGSRVLAEGAFETLRTRLRMAGVAELHAAPGPRARLYKLARSIADERGGTAKRGDVLPWLPPRRDAPPSYGAALARARRELSRDEAEVLELRYTRELSPEELVYVLEKSLSDISAELLQVAERVARMLGANPPSRLGGLRGAFLELFALQEPSSRAPLDERRALPMGTIIGERYAVEVRVGEGSFGDVYRALDADVPGHVVALKLLHKAATNDDARRAALRELRLIASVFHPSVVNFKDHGWYEDRLWFVMPWYAGETLEERIKRAPLSRAEALRIFVPLAQALATMHESGLRHQDIKPDNILLARVGRGAGAEPDLLPVLIDLGVAASDAEMIVAGTPLYFAPEIAVQYAHRPDKPPVTAKADVFSLALVLRNALEPATQEKVPGHAVEAFIAHRAVSPPGGPSDRKLAFLAPHFRRWLALDPAARPSAAELADELHVLTRPERTGARRRATLVWAAPLALCAVFGFSSMLYVYLQERDEARAAQRLAQATHSKLDRESALRMRLEEDVQHGELTQQQLRGRLDERVEENQRIYTQLNAVRKDNAEMVGRLQLYGTELDSARRDREAALVKLEAMESRAAALGGQLFSTEQRRALTESELREVRARMTAAESELDELRMRSRTLLSELDRARNATESQLERVAELEVALGVASRDRSRLERELDDVRAKHNALESRSSAIDQRPGILNAL